MEFRKNTDYQDFIEHYLELNTEGFEDVIPEAEYDVLGDYDLSRYKED